MGFRTASLLCLIFTLLVPCHPAYGQRGSYMEFIRPDIRPPLVGTAEAADSLWGPLEASERGDGIVESRRAELEELVRRFTPTVFLPGADYTTVNGRKYRMYPSEARLLTDTLSVDRFSTAPYEFNDFLDIPIREQSPESLLSLIETALGYQSDPHTVSAWYFDFPGDDPKAWWEAYGEYRTGPDSALWAQPTVYAHPFMDAQGRIVIQYWYCYPFNDYVGNHEGDWEHVNVLLTADRSAVAGVEYYFHAQSISMPQGKYKPEMVDGTHPVAYVGGRMYNILDYPIRLFFGDRNEGSHGHYPYSGEWEGAAGLGATESVGKPGKDSSRVLSHDKFRVILMPDPGRIDYRRKPEVLKEWFWLILPARWGFPAAPSLGSEVKLVDVGNRAPFGPAYSSAFNRTAPTLLFSAYYVRRLSKSRSYVEDLLQPWYWLYAFRTPRFVNDTRGKVDRKTLERLGLAPRGGWAERGIGSPILGVCLGIPEGDFGDVYGNSFGIFLWRNLWVKLRIGALEFLGGYQKFPRGDGNEGSLFVYPFTGNFVLRAPDALFRPYASIGGGAYGWEARTPVPAEDGQFVKSGWDLGWNVGVGVEYYLRPKVAFDVSLRFHSTVGPGSSGEIARKELRFLTLWFGHYLRF